MGFSIELFLKQLVIEKLLTQEDADHMLEEFDFYGLHNVVSELQGQISELKNVIRSFKPNYDIDTMIICGKSRKEQLEYVRLSDYIDSMGK